MQHVEYVGLDLTKDIFRVQGANADGKRVCAGG